MKLEMISDWKEIGIFSSFEEESQYWQNHQIHPTLLNEALYRSASTESTTISLRIDPRMLARIKRLAGQRYLNYQSMIKQWLAERLEKELEGR